MQVFFVMLFFPVIMNALQYYIIDGFIKNQKPADHEQIPSEDEEDEGLDGHENHRRTGSRSLRNRLDENSDTAVDEIDTPKTADDRKLLARKLSRDSKDVKLLDEYNPATDGERTASSSSSSLKEQEELSEASKDGVANRKRTSTSDSN